VSKDDRPRDADFKTERSRLNEGLKTCRAVVANYRALLSGDDEDPAANNDEMVSSSESA
jgi:hypothetical protein